MAELFGTDGIRGVAGQDPLDQRTVYKIGVCLTRLLKVKTLQPKILLARDTRASGLWIEELLVQGIEKSSGSVVRAGVVSTPCVSFLTRTLKLDAGIMISASHNPYQDNGIKIFANNGLKLPEELETRLEKEILQGENFEFEPVSEIDFQMCDLRYFDRGCIESYVNFLLSVPKSSADLSGMKIVLDCANGAVFKLAPKIFSSVGANTVLINDKPDGYNINLSCGSTYPEAAKRAVLENKADFGVSFDGDADRAFFIDKDGKLIDGDHVLFILSKYVSLKKPVIVGTIMSNIGLEMALQQNGIKLIRTPVGDKYVLEEMLRTGVNIGGEQSGHIILSDYSLAGDGLLTALVVFNLVVESRSTLAQLAEGLRVLPQVLVNVRVSEKIPFATIPEIDQELRNIKARLGESSRIVLRYSGTEPLARIMIEGESQTRIQTEASNLARLISQKLS